jgi:hypothetical protein
LNVRPDSYLRIVLTVIAAALVYLRVVLTPMPAASAQGAVTPGTVIGPAEVTIVGWRLAPNATFPIHIPGRVTVNGEVRVSNDLRVTGKVETEQAAGSTSRVVLSGWEDAATPRAAGKFTPWNSGQGAALPVAPLAR